MRILYGNAFAGSGIFTATNEDANYPIEETTDNSLKSLFKSTTSTTLIEKSLPSAQTIKALAFGNTNATQIQVTFYNQALTAIYQETITGAEIQFNGSFPGNILYTGGDAGISQVKYIDLDCDGPDPVYIGGLFAGSYIQYDLIVPRPETEFPSTATVEKTRYGLAFGVPGEVLETFSCTVGDDIDLSGYNEFKNFWREVQRNNTVWVDIWHSVDILPPMFCNITNRPGLNKLPGAIYWDGLSFDFEECK